MANKKNKKNNEKRVLAAALCISVVAIAGSTFAWFTSKDEVTNRLSASAAYDVSIAEDFTPPEVWIPGQTIDKNVGVVNTGNTDAFVRTWVEGEMNLLNQTKDVAKWNATQKDFYAGNTRIPGSTAADVTDADLLALGLTKKFTDNGNTYYLKTLSKEEQQNPNLNNPDAVLDGTTAADTNYSEVKTVQAGGYLAYTTGTKYSFTPNQEIEVKTSNGNTYKVAKGVKVIVDTDAATESSADVSSVSDSFTTKVPYIGAIDSDSFKPESSGLYIFRRNVKYNGADPEAASADDYEFSGYDYVTSGSEDGTVANQGTYYALQYQATDENENDKQRSDYTLATNALTVTDADNDGILEITPTADLALFTAEEKQITNDQLKWYYTAADTSATPPVAAMLHAFYDVNRNNIYDREDIMIDIALANINNSPTAATAETWTVLDSAGSPTISTLPSSSAGSNENKNWTFYYNNDLEEGDTTARFIDSVTLNKDVTQYSYMAFDFDLNVFMDSIQVTIDENGNEGFDTVSGGWAVSDDTAIAHNNATAAKAGATIGEPEINTITWTKIS